MKPGRRRSSVGTRWSRPQTLPPDVVCRPARLRGGAHVLPRHPGLSPRCPEEVGWGVLIRQGKTRPCASLLHPDLTWRTKRSPWRTLTGRGAPKRSTWRTETVDEARSDLTWRTQGDVASGTPPATSGSTRQDETQCATSATSARHVAGGCVTTKRHAPRRAGCLHHTRSRDSTPSGNPPGPNHPPGPNPESRHRRPHPQQAGPRPSTLAASPTTPQRPDLTHRTAHMAHATRHGAPKPSTWRARISHGAPKATWRAVHRPPRPVQRAKTKLSAPRQPLQRARRGDPAEQPVVTGFGRADSGNCRTPRRDWQTCRD